MRSHTPRRLGIYGGTFDPPHNAHVRAARAFLCEMELDELYIMPAAIPPHKRVSPDDDPALRLAMTQGAFDGVDPRITVSDYEISRADVSYTYKTLTHFAETTDAELYFLCGTDMFLTLHSWRYPEIIFEKAVVVCAMREKDPAAFRAVMEKEKQYVSRYGARIRHIKEPPMELSSSEIRQIYGDGGDISHLVPSAVCRIIHAHHLYGSDYS